MKKSVKTTFFLTLVAAITMWMVSPAVAQDKPADNMQILRDKIKADKKLLVAANMELTESEAKAFWPVYEKYQKELFLLRARTLKLIKDYADAYEKMSNDKAKALMDELMKIDSLTLKLRQAYLPKFRQVLPEVKVVRYYQLENKLNAVVNFELAANIPLMKAAQ
jgi:DNA-directed RNA polymerase subunit F